MGSNYQGSAMWETDQGKNRENERVEMFDGLCHVLLGVVSALHMRLVRCEDRCTEHRLFQKITATMTALTARTYAPPLPETACL